MHKGNFMKEQKNIIKLSNLLLDGLFELKKARLHKMRSSFEDFCCRCRQVTKDSHLFYAAVGKNWLSSADKIKTKVGRNINDFSYHLQNFKDLVNSDETKLPKLADLFAELSQIDEELGDVSSQHKWHRLTL